MATVKNWIDKAEAVRLTWKYAESLMARVGCPFEGGCVYYAAVARAALHCEFGVPLRDIAVQAGTMQWPRLDPEQDDGRPETPSHFSYVFEPESDDTRARVAAGELPEMHVWLAVRTPFNEWEILDVTTKHLAARTAGVGLDWPGKAPPPYVWCPPGDPLLARTVFRPHPAAVLLAEMYIHSIMQENS